MESISVPKTPEFVSHVSSQKQGAISLEMKENNKPPDRNGKNSSLRSITYSMLSTSKQTSNFSDVQFEGSDLEKDHLGQILDH